jgi:hypothetical protein
MSELRSSVPYGFCHCGCGETSSLAKRSDSRADLVAGEPCRFKRGHHNKIGPDYVVDPKTGCWNWQRARFHGYGQLRFEGRQQTAHRVYYQRYVGPIPDGFHVDHLCENKACVNPEHLEAVTVAVNIRRSRRTPITPEIAAKIRASSESGPILAERYHVTKGSIYRIRRGERWGASS